MNALADASSLIVLARQDALWLLHRTFGTVALVNGVYNETVVQGKAKGYSDAFRIEKAITASALIVVTPTIAEQQLADAFARSTSALSRIDCLTLACAKERGWTLVMEERRGRNVAMTQSIPYVTIQVLPIQAFIARQVSFLECEDLLRRIGRAMHTDEAVLTILLAAANEIYRLRAEQVS